MSRDCEAEMFDDNVHIHECDQPKGHTGPHTCCGLEWKEAGDE